MFPTKASKVAVSVALASGLFLSGCNHLKGPQQALTPVSKPDDNHLRIYLNELTVEGNSSQYDGMTLHVWNDATCGAYDGADTDWASGLAITDIDPNFGAYWDLPYSSDEPTGCVNFLPHKGDYKPLPGNGTADISKAKEAGWFSAFTFRGESDVHYSPLIAPPVTLSGATAHWINSKTLLMPQGAERVQLYASRSGDLSFDGTKILGADKTIEATKKTTRSWADKLPHLSALESWSLTASDAEVKDLLKGQIYAATLNSEGKIVSITQVQTARVLDDLYVDKGTADDEALQFGAVIDGKETHFRLWAPTARKVSLIDYGPDQQIVSEIPMSYDEASGSWFVSSSKMGHGRYYRYKVDVYHPAVDEVRTLEVTDPYSLSLSMNSLFSQVVDLNHPDLKPAGWSHLDAPHSQSTPSEMVIYESHVRDFSAFDQTVAEKNRGKFKAFTEQNATSVKHLKSLADSGVTHLHLLPVFDIATINENKEQVANVDQPFQKLCEVNASVKDSEFKRYCETSASISDVLAELKALDSSATPKVQKLNLMVANTDSFNWGYDPLHYTVPEGSYSTNPDGMQRILEFRQMITSIKRDIGMNVVMDVVYNHTNAAGPDSAYSVLDKIVPWYYQRLNSQSGKVETSTCCANTAPENAMMGRLVKDSLVTWSEAYKIDAYRFDLMGHHPKEQILDALQAVQAVDSDTYFYGEGWNFGEVENDAQFVQATQKNLSGTGIGTFSDRLRDAVRGGGPFDSGEDIRRKQGYGNGAFVMPNEMNGVTREQALHQADLVRLGMAGNLKNFKMETYTGEVKAGEEMDYSGSPAGYANDPTEIQNYVSKHDNQTLWDNNQYKLPEEIGPQLRTRIQAISLATVMFGQGIPFTHQGVELLRSKSMERDSYDSADWYNKVDYTLTDNNWNKGLPRADKDQDNWALIEQVIANDNTQARPDDMAHMVEYYKELTRLRKNYPLLTLGTGDEVNRRVDFHNTGKAQLPGLIVMSIDNGAGVSDKDTRLDGLMVAINASNKDHSLDVGVKGLTVSTQHSTDLSKNASVNGSTLTVPSWSAVVYELKRSGARGTGIPVSPK